ncbi:MAG TPA: bifunctional methylenetetrahydrofolate dehydrogenase/methenyltetrahydrofolate cyclohydrolase [Candidatus Portnoybacteria bacterium]|nr:bifunctional methylenetetrahydrofolate dehydrogenase/methenyltetrahydrofolate cyclohydrolase [Candidatus Portnoybacteria bacterium]
MMKLFDGKKAAGKILKELAANIKKEKLRPGLAVILVGDDSSSKLYVKLKKEAAAKVGINFESYVFDSQAKEEEIIGRIKELNENKNISGIIVQLPLPAVFNTDKIIEAIDPAKDVDGFHKENLKLLEKGKENLVPVLPSAILAALSAATSNKLAGQEIFALVNSEFFGRALKIILERGGAKINYLVRNTCVVFGSEKEIKSADVIISVCGCPQMIKGEMIKDGAILIDAGITHYHDGKVMGDVDRQSVEKKAAFMTPASGGIGPLTVALLLRNVYLATKGLVRK